MENNTVTVDEHYIPVLDIGGRGGLHRCWNQFAFPLEYFSFEPEPEEYVRLLEIAKNASSSGNRYHVLNTAIDGETGERLFNIYSNRAGCSFYENVPGGCYRFANNKLERKVPVQTISIGDLAERENITPRFMTIDVEGAELGILMGGEAVLKRDVLGLRCEVELSNIYLDAPEFDEVVGYMRKIGFILVRIETCNSGMYGITTDMNKYSVSPMDAMPLSADLIFLNEALIRQLIEAAPGNASALIFDAVLFGIHNGCGYRAMDFLELAVERGHLTAYESSRPDDYKRLLQHVAAYFAVPRKNINKNFDPKAAMRDLTRRSFEEVLASASDSVCKKISDVYNDDMLFGRLMAPERQYDTHEYE